MAATSLPPLPVPLDQMTESELCNYVPQMVRSSTGKSRPFWGKNQTPPDWWPKNVPYGNPKIAPRDKRKKGDSEVSFVDVLRQIVRNCFESHGQEHLLKREKSADKTKDNSKKDTVSAAAPLSHQSKARVLPNNLYPSPAMASLPTPATQPLITDNTPQKGDESPFVEVFICFFCEKQFQTKSALQCHQKDCSERPKENDGDARCHTPPRRLCDSTSKTASQSSPTKLQLDLDNRTAKEKMLFLECFELGSISKVESLKRKQQRNRVECGPIDCTDDPCLKTPTTPRSAKSLISQLSRDMSPTSVQRNLLMDALLGDGSDSESTKSDSNEEVNVGRSASLYAIDLTSLLGQRIKRHIGADKQQTTDGEDEAHPYEPFCHTPKKDAFPSRLRNRQNPFPVTYKKKKGSGHYCHEFKFNKRDKREFKIKLRTGLNHQARKLKAQLQDCKVVMHKFTSKEIRRFTRPRPRHFIDMRLPNWEVKFMRGPMYVQGTPHFPQGVFMNGSPVDLQRMLGVRMPNLAVPHTQTAVRFPGLSPIVSQNMNRNVYRPPPATATSAAGPQVQGLFPNLSRQMGLIPNGLPQNTFYRQSATPATSSGPLHLLQRQQLNSTQIRDDHSKENKMASLAKKGQPVDPHKKPMAMTNGNVRRRGSLDSTGSEGSKSRSKKTDDDVIAISSSDEEESSAPGQRTKKRKRSQQKDESDSKRHRAADEKNSASPNKRNQAVLFRCHLCFAEIMFNLATTEFISRHFAQEHKVPNIQILEHRDERGQLVLSIVEDSQLEQAAAAQNRKAPGSAIKAAISNAQEKRRQGALQTAAASDDVICID